MAPCRYFCVLWGAGANSMLSGIDESDKSDKSDESDKSDGVAGWVAPWPESGEGWEGWGRERACLGSCVGVDGAVRSWVSVGETVRVWLWVWSGCGWGQEWQGLPQIKIPRDGAGHFIWVMVVADLFSGSFGLSGGSLFGRSFSGSFGSLFSGLGGCDFGFLLGYCLGLGGILGLLFLETCLGSELAFVGHSGFLSVDSLLFLGFPGVETTLCLSLVEGAFLHAALEVFHQHHALLREDRAYGVGGLCTNVNPIQSPFEIECDCSRISVRIIGTYPFNKLTISWCPAIGDNNWIERIVFTTMTL